MCMRTTLQIDDQLMRAAKKLAAETGRTLASVVEDALRRALAGGDRPTKHRPSKLPVFSMGGTLPGVDLDNTAALIDLMEEGDDSV